MSQAERKWDQEELDLFEAGRAEAPPAGSANSVLASLGLEAPPGPGGGGETAPVSGPAPASPSPAPAASGIFARPSTWIGAGAVALALIPIGLTLSSGDEPTTPQTVSNAAETSKASGTEATSGAEAATPSGTSEALLEAAPEESEQPVAKTPAPTTGASTKTALKGAVAPNEKETSTETAKRPSLAEELAIIKRARASLNSGNLSGADAALAEHAKKFTPPRLATEARVIRVELLLKRGQRAQAKQLAAPLMKKDSPYRARMETLLSTQ